MISSAPAHRELGLADLNVTAFWIDRIDGGPAEVEKKVVPLSKVNNGTEDKNKQIFDFNLEAGVWNIEVKSTDLNFASYTGDSVITFLPKTFFSYFTDCKSFINGPAEIEITAEMVAGSVPIEPEGLSIKLGETNSFIKLFETVVCFRVYL